MSLNKRHHDYDTWYCQMYSGSETTDPLRFPWYNSAFAHIKQNACGKLLEIGCGRGEFALWLAKMLPDVDVTAVDFSSAAISVAKQFADDRCVNIRLAQDDAQGLKFPDNYFDYVVSCECIEHVPKPQRMAKELCRVLKPGGHFSITTENYFNGVVSMDQELALQRAVQLGIGRAAARKLLFFLAYSFVSSICRFGLRQNREQSLPMASAPAGRSCEALHDTFFGCLGAIFGKAVWPTFLVFWTEAKSASR
jgi:2-polyprenyl-3-methyl-5-hydroxy-6-metoxy-1,4-benzoquinol methylase